MDKAIMVSACLIALGVIFIIHHCIFWHRPFDLTDILHHEFFEAIFLTAGITLLIATSIRRGRSDGK